MGFETGRKTYRKESKKFFHLFNVTYITPIHFAQSPPHIYHAIIA